MITAVLMGIGAEGPLESRLERYSAFGAIDRYDRLDFVVNCTVYDNILNVRDWAYLSPHSRDLARYLVGLFAIKSASQSQSGREEREKVG